MAATFVVILAVAGALLILIPGALTVVGSRGDSLRPDIWKAYTDHALRSQFVGAGGILTVDMFIPKGNFTIDQPHNIVLSAQVRGGLAGMLAMVTILVSSFWGSWRCVTYGGSPVPLALITTVATTGMFDYNIVITPPTWPWLTFWLPFAVCAGAEVAVRHYRQTGLKSAGRPLQMVDPIAQDLRFVDPIMKL